MYDKMPFTKEQEEAIEILVGLCTSCKEASTLTQLLKEYSEMEGKRLDYTGFKTITDFLEASGRFIIFYRGGLQLISAKLTVESAHIAMLVNKQKTPRKKKGFGIPSRDGLFDKTNARKTYRSYPPRSLQQPRSLSYNSQHNSNNKPYQKRNVAPNLKITKPFHSAGFPKTFSAPLPSQLAKVVTPEVQKTAPPVTSAFKYPAVGSTKSTPLPSQLAKVVTPENQKTTPPSSSGFKFPSTKPKADTSNLPPLPSQLAKVIKPEIQNTTPPVSVSSSATQNPLPKLTTVMAPQNDSLPTPQVTKSVEQTTQGAVRKQPVPLRVDLPKSDTTMRIQNETPKIDRKDYNNNNRHSTPPITGNGFSSLNEKTVFKPMINKDHEQRVPPIGEHNVSCLNKLNRNVDVMKRPTVQDRLKQIKLSTPQYEFPRQVVTKETPIPKDVTKENSKVVIPLEWWTTGDYNNVERLEEYCRLKQLIPPNFKTFTAINMNKTKYQCRCFVDGVTYSTYPDDFDTEDQARNACATIAISTIQHQEELSQYPPFLGSPQEIASMIYDIVKQYNNGVFLTEIPKIFRSKHKLSLPSDYAKIISDFKGLFTVDSHFVNSLVLKPIVYLNVSTYEGINSLGDNKILPEIKLPWNEKHWNVYVTFPETTTSVWVNLLGKDYNDAYLDMNDKLEVAQLEHAKQICQDKYYITVVHGNRQRVRIVEINNGQYMSHFIDSGEHETLSEEQLFICDPEFLSLAPQAVQMSLKGLSLFDKLNGIDFCLSDLSDEVMVAVVHSSETQYKQTKSVEVTLYDTSTEEDININDKLIDEIADLALKPTKLSGKFISVIITGLDVSGIITCYLKYGGYNNMIKTEIERIVSDKSNLEQCGGIPEDIDEATKGMYLLYNHNTNEYLRAEIVDFGKNETVTVLLIDHGTQVTISKDSYIYRISTLFKGLTIIPPQAIHVRYQSVNMNNPHEMSLVRSYLGPGVDTYFQIVDPEDEPLVEIYVKTRGKVICISKEIKEQLNYYSTN